jgi:hypothetical protein
MPPSYGRLDEEGGDTSRRMELVSRFCLEDLMEMPVNYTAGEDMEGKEH